MFTGGARRDDRTSMHVAVTPNAAAQTCTHNLQVQGCQPAVAEAAALCPVSIHSQAADEAEAGSG